MTTTRDGALLAGILAVGVAACVAIPQEVEQTFSPASPGETSYYRRHPDAPLPAGFVLPAASVASAAPSSAPSASPSASQAAAAAAPSASAAASSAGSPADGGAP